TQVRIGDKLYYVKSLKNGAKSGTHSNGELNVNLIHEFEHFILRVKGDSMNQAGIDDGDYVIVRAQPHGSSGDIVVAQIKEEEAKATLKRFKSETTDAIILRPETDNPSIDPDGFTFTKKDVDDSDKVMILGVALAVLKPVN
ncbi:MAG TPA: S24 family peptidase, partial [Anaerolineales bacterium]|nr:S24 family peptidase [Anaerolineales bacterium]